MERNLGKGITNKGEESEKKKKKKKEILGVPGTSLRTSYMLMNLILNITL